MHLRLIDTGNVQTFRWQERVIAGGIDVIQQAGKL
jgi:hypothetical protein